MWDLGQREFRRALQEVIRVEKVAALEIPMKNEDRIWQALRQDPSPRLPHVVEAWGVFGTRREPAYATTYIVWRSFYTTTATPFFCILLPDGTVAVTFGSSRDDIAPLVNRIAIDRAFKAFGYEFPGSLRDETAFTIAWDLLTQGDRDSIRPDLSKILSTRGDVLTETGTIAFGEITWGRGIRRNCTLSWDPRHVTLAVPVVGEARSPLDRL
jgi:hypothetical protein